MRHGRAKAARKTLQFYSLNSDIRPPYRILVDGNFLAAAAKQKVPIFDRLSKLLQRAEFALHVTRSALDELASLPGEVFEEARQFGLDECEIVERDSIPGEKRGEGRKDDGGGGGDAKRGRTKSGNGGEGSSVVRSSSSLSTLGDAGNDIRLLVSDGTNRRGYLVGTQDETLSDVLRGLPYVPQLRLSRGVLLLEAPSSASRRRTMSQERGKMMTGGGLATKEEREMVAAVRQRERAAAAQRRRDREGRGGTGSAAAQRTKKKARGPNPLSCKKRKSSEAAVASAAGEEKKKRRRRKGKGTAASASTGDDA